MKKLLILVILVLVFIGGGFILLRSSLGSKSEEKAVLKVVSTPEATIFLDNQNIGKTPFEDKVDGGEFTIKLIPETTVGSIVSWEGKVGLNPGLLTYVSRDLGTSELNSEGEILTLEKVTGKDAELAVVSVPDGAVVAVDGEERGTTPIVLKELKPDSYELAVSALGYKSRSIKVKTTSGYKLNAVFNLAASGEEVIAESTDEETSEDEESTSGEDDEEASPKPSATSQKSPPPKPYVEISDTPTGFLRVRDNPSTSSGKEVSKVDPGEYYPLLDEENGWYKIEYEDGEEGWISGKYAEKFE